MAIMVYGQTALNKRYTLRRLSAARGSVLLGHGLRHSHAALHPQFASPANLRFAYSGLQTVVYLERNRRERTPHPQSRRARRPEPLALVHPADSNAKLVERRRPHAEGTPRDALGLLPDPRAVTIGTPIAAGSELRS